MTHVATTRPRASFAANFTTSWKSFWRGVERRRLVRNTHYVLSQLDDATLRDIGLTRGSIRAFNQQGHHWDLN